MIYVLLFLLAFASITLIGYALYALDQRMLETSIQFANYIAQLNKDVETLNSNQKTLESDLKKVFGEFQNAKKEISRQQRQHE